MAEVHIVRLGPGAGLRRRTRRGGEQQQQRGSWKYFYSRDQCQRSSNILGQ